MNDMRMISEPINDSYDIRNAKYHLATSDECFVDTTVNQSRN